MSLSLSNVDQIEFDEMVKKIYQSQGFLLRGTMRERTNVQGTQVSFRTMGQISAENYAFQTQVNWQDPDYQPVNVTLEPWRAATLIDDLQQFLYNFDARREDAEAVAMALGRRTDQIGIDALNASTPPAENLIAAGGTGMSFDKVRKIAGIFSRKAVPPSMRYIAITGTAEEQLLASLQFTSNQFTQLGAVTKGSLNGANVMGMNWIVIPDMDEGGLPLAGDIRTCFAWHKMAMGIGTGRDFRTIIERVPHLDSWQILGKFFSQAKAVDPKGIIKINIDETVEPVISLTVGTIDLS